MTASSPDGQASGWILGARPGFQSAVVNRVAAAPTESGLAW
ncbi:hypothetical protein ACFFLM_03295 [Deinococcus oregonensis]|uniref:Uncharacterized protein n=1 Tax=Deinococcus oregonensis TaxID=1805970 RepID=A0ABV6AU21_9DEIO